MTWTRISTVIGGSAAPDGWTVLRNRWTVGRVSRQPQHGPIDPAWLWASANDEGPPDAPAGRLSI
ncbi:hypothetical protein ACX9MO_05125 [Pseudooceanicola sp. 502str34]